MDSVLDWDAVEGQLATLLQATSFDQRTAENAHDLMGACRGQCAPPTTVDKGYWNTISLSWPNWEVEIFDDRFELYHFRENGFTDITYFARDPGSAPSQAMIDQLPKGV